MKDLILEYVDAILGEECALTAAAGSFQDQVITVAPIPVKEERLMDEVLVAPVSR